MQPVYKSGGNDRYDPASYRRIFLLNTLTKLFEGLIESRLITPFTELRNTLTSVHQGSRLQTHDAMYALMSAIQQRKQVSDMPTYCFFIYFSTAYPSLRTPKEISLTP
jgi:hypothetical protein